MLSRYTRPEMRALFAELEKKKRWHGVERAVLGAKEFLGFIPIGTFNLAGQVAVTEKLLHRADEFEAVTDHDLIAFVHAVTEELNDAVRPYYHDGCTSYDIEDTAGAMIMRDALRLIVAGVATLRQTIFTVAKRHKDTIMVGRTHDIHAEAITFGLYLLDWVKVLDAHLERLYELEERVAVGKISGAVGRYALPPIIEERACEILGLKAAKTSTQVLSRDIYYEYASKLVGVANSLDRFATNIRSLAGTDIGEVAEHKKPGAKGSSAMPGKSRLRNPIKSENVCSLAKVCRGQLIIAAECEQLWHQRTLDNSAAERHWLPDLSTLVHFMLYRFNEVMAMLEVYPEQMLRNLNRTGGIIYAQQIMMALTARGIPRKSAYELLEAMALDVEPGTFLTSFGATFREQVEGDNLIISLLSPDEIAECFDPTSGLKYVDDIFARFENLAA